MARRCHIFISICLTVMTIFDSVAAAAGTREIGLPKPRLESRVSVEEALLKRRSIRSYAAAPLTMSDVGQLLWAAQGVTSATGQRAAPSAGALYPLELYVVAGQVTGLAAGVYRYIPKNHSLVQVTSSDRRAALAKGAWGQQLITGAPASLVFSGVFTRTTRKYGERGVRYVYMDAAHAAENVYLQAVALDLGTFIIGGFDDRLVAQAVDLPVGEEPVAIMPLGRPKRP